MPSLFRRTFPQLLLALALTLAPAARAQTALLLTPGTTGAQRSDGDFSFGFQFTVGSQSLTLTQLGVFDFGANGLANSHQVGIWDSTGTTLLGQVTVAAGTSSTLIDGFRYESLGTAVVLSAGSTYVIAAFYPSGNTDVWMDRIGNNATFSSTITAVSPLYSNLTTLSFPALTTDGQTNPFGAANAIYSAVPEPSTYAAIAGALVLGAAVIVRRKRQGDVQR